MTVYEGLGSGDLTRLTTTSGTLMAGLVPAIVVL